MKPQNQAQIDVGGLFLGVLLGTLVGGMVALFKAPLLHLSMRQSKPVSAAPEVPLVKATPTMPADPVAESRAQGAAAARRRRIELGV